MKKPSKKVNVLEIREATPTKIGLHAFHINLYLHEFFESILFFDPLGPWFEREFWPNLKRSKISEIREAIPTKIGCMQA